MGDNEFEGPTPIKDRFDSAVINSISEGDAEFEKDIFEEYKKTYVLSTHMLLLLYHSLLLCDVHTPSMVIIFASTNLTYLRVNTNFKNLKEALANKDLPNSTLYSHDIKVF